MELIVSVVVVAKNEEKYIGPCLTSLVKQSFPEDNFEIIVVDGSSRDRTQEICRRFPVKLVVTSGGISHQRNVGIDTARGKHVAFIDADCAADQHWLARLVAQAEESDGQTIAVGGPNVVPDADPPLSRIIGYSQETFLGSGGSAQSYRFRDARYVNSIPNCNILYKKQMLNGARYNEGLSVGDDCEFNFRLRRNGYKFLYFNGAVVWHHRPGNLGRFIRKMFAYGEALGRVTRQHRTIVRWYAPVAALAALGVIFAYPIVRFFFPAAYFYTLAIVLYLMALGVATAQVYRKCKSFDCLMTAVLLPLQHFFYGLGFLKGLLAR